MNPEKRQRGRVLSMNGEEVQRERVTRDEFIEADEAQQRTLIAAGRERKLLGGIRGKIERGAEIEDCEYYFDPRLGIVRHKRMEPGSEGPPPVDDREVGS